MYLYISQIALFLQFDYGFLSELTTRWSILISEESGPFFEKMTKLIIESENVDWYLVGFQVGLIWQLAFDVKL